MPRRRADLYFFLLQSRQQLDALKFLAIAMAESVLRFHPVPCGTLRRPKRESKLRPRLALVREHSRT